MLDDDLRSVVVARHALLLGAGATAPS